MLFRQETATTFEDLLTQGNVDKLNTTHAASELLTCSIVCAIRKWTECNSARGLVLPCAAIFNLLWAMLTLQELEWPPLPIFSAVQLVCRLETGAEKMLAADVTD